MLGAFRDAGRFVRDCSFRFLEREWPTERVRFAWVLLTALETFFFETSRLFRFAEVFWEEPIVCLGRSILGLRRLNEFSVLATILPNTEPILRAVEPSRLCPGWLSSVWVESFEFDEAP